MCGAEANRATAGDLPQPQPHVNFNLRTSLILRTDNLLAGKLILPFEGRLLAIVLSSAAQLVEIIPAKPNPVPGFRPENCSASSRNRCSPSSRNRVQLTPDSSGRATRRDVCCSSKLRVVSGEQ